MFSGFLSSFEKHCFLSQTGEATFWTNFGKTWATFYFKIGHIACQRQNKARSTSNGKACF